MRLKDESGRLPAKDNSVDGQPTWPNTAKAAHRKTLSRDEQREEARQAVATLPPDSGVESKFNTSHNSQTYRRIGARRFAGVAWRRRTSDWLRANTG